MLLIVELHGQFVIKERELIIWGYIYIYCTQRACPDIENERLILLSNPALHFDYYRPLNLDHMHLRPKYRPLTDSEQCFMDAIPEHTRSFSDLVSRVYAIVNWEDMDQAFLQLVTKFFDVDKGAVVKFHDDKDDFETVASLWTDDLEIRRQVRSWRSKLPSFSKDGELAENHGYLLKRNPSKLAHSVSELFQRLTVSGKETALLSVISKRQPTSCLIWLHRNADKPDLMPYDLELLKMVLPHLRQAIDFRRQINNLKAHLRGNGYVA